MIANDNFTISSTECVCHSCDNRICCNPKHLWLGSVLENNRDCIQKGRRGIFPIGVNHPGSKFTEEDVLDIRFLLLWNVPVKSIAFIFNVGVTAVKNIKLGNRYTEIY